MLKSVSYIAAVFWWSNIDEALWTPPPPYEKQARNQVFITEKILGLENDYINSV